MKPLPGGSEGAGDVSGAVLSTGTGTGAALGLSGDIDADATERLRAQLDDAIVPGAVLTVDLARVTHLSQPALAVLVQAHRRLQDSGGALLLEGLSDPVVRLLRISGLHRVFNVDGETESDDAESSERRQATGA